VRLDDAEDFVVAYGFAGVIDVDDAGVERGTGAVGVDDVGEVEDQAGTGVFAGGFLREEDGCLDPGGRGPERVSPSGQVMFSPSLQRG